MYIYIRIYLTNSHEWLRYTTNLGNVIYKPIYIHNIESSISTNQLLIDVKIYRIFIKDKSSSSYYSVSTRYHMTSTTQYK